MTTLLILPYAVGLTHTPKKLSSDLGQSPLKLLWQTASFNLLLYAKDLFCDLFIRKLLLDVAPLVVAAIWLGLSLKTIQEK